MQLKIILFFIFFSVSSHALESVMICDTQDKKQSMEIVINGDKAEIRLVSKVNSSYENKVTQYIVSKKMKATKIELTEIMQKNNISEKLVRGVAYSFNDGDKFVLIAEDSLKVKYLFEMGVGIFLIGSSSSCL